MKQGIINYQQLLDNLSVYATKIGRISTRPAVLLYYLMVSSDTPKSDKLLILSALSYLVLPIDFISAKRLPIIGWLDEIVSLTVAYQKVCRYITPEIEMRADSLLDKWFPTTEIANLN